MGTEVLQAQKTAYRGLRRSQQGGLGGHQAYSMGTRTTSPSPSQTNHDKSPVHMTHDHGITVALLKDPSAHLPKRGKRRRSHSPGGQ